MLDIKEGQYLICYR